MQSASTVRGGERKEAGECERMAHLRHNSDELTDPEQMPVGCEDYAILNKTVAFLHASFL